MMAGATPVDTALDQVGRRVNHRVGVGIIGPGGGDEALDVFAEPIVQKDVLVDGGAQPMMLLDMSAFSLTRLKSSFASFPLPRAAVRC
jgi:hypothetical protein